MQQCCRSRSKIAAICETPLKRPCSFGPTKANSTRTKHNALQQTYQKIYKRDSSWTTYVGHKGKTCRARTEATVGASLSVYTSQERRQSQSVGRAGSTVPPSPPLLHVRFFFFFVHSRESWVWKTPLSPPQVSLALQELLPAAALIGVVAGVTAAAFCPRSWEKSVVPG